MTDPLLQLGIPLGAKAHYGTKTTISGVSGATLSVCALTGLSFNLVGGYIELLDDVWLVDQELTVWESSTLARLPKYSAQNVAMLFKNGVLINDDEWEWESDIRINLLSDTYSISDTWVISYEQKKEIETPTLDMTSFSALGDTLVDGYVFQKYEGTLKEFDIQEYITFGNTYEAQLRIAWCAQRRGTLTTRSGRNVVGWKFTSDTVIQIEPYEFNPSEEYVLAYTGVWDWFDYSGVEVYLSQGDGAGMSAYELVKFDQRVDYHKYYKIKIVFRKQIRAGDVRVRSLVMKSV